MFSSHSNILVRYRRVSCPECCHRSSRSIRWVWAEAIALPKQKPSAMALGLSMCGGCGRFWSINNQFSSINWYFEAIFDPVHYVEQLSALKLACSLVE
jgi:hypothetical protein